MTFAGKEHDTYRVRNDNHDVYRERFMENFITRTSEIKKPVEAIQCANNFSLLQRKMYNVLLANAAGKLFPDMTHRITMRTLCASMNYRSNDYKTIKGKFRELRRMDMEWDIINDNGNKVWTNTSPLSLARVIEGEGICEYEFTPSLVPFLDRPAQYAKFSLAIQAQFKSAYGLALYENCERYRNIGYTRAFDVLTFRKLMGVKPGEYLEFFALKRRVIVKAVEEVNKYADFEVKPEYKKEGRVVSSIRLIINSKKSEEKILPSKKVKNSKGHDALNEKTKTLFGLSDLEIERITRKYGHDYVENKVRTILESDSFKNGYIKNMAGYLKSALTDDYQPTRSSKSIAEVQRRNKETLMVLRKEFDELSEKIHQRYDDYVTKKIPEHLKTLTKKERDVLMLNFEDFLKNTNYFRAYQEEGIRNSLVLMNLVQFVKNNNPILLEAIITFDRYAEKHQPQEFSKMKALETEIKTSIARV